MDPLLSVEGLERADLVIKNMRLDARRLKITIEGLRAKAQGLDDGVRNAGLSLEELKKRIKEP